METIKFTDFIKNSSEDSDPDFTVGIKQDSTIKIQPLYKKYIAQLTQSGTNAPIAVVLENTLGDDPTYLYGSVGTYSLNLMGAFPSADKTYIMVTSWGRQPVKIFWNSADQLPIRTSILIGGAFVFSDDVLADTTIEIRVYS